MLEQVREEDVILARENAFQIYKLSTFTPEEKEAAAKRYAELAREFNNQPKSNKETQ